MFTLHAPIMLLCGLGTMVSWGLRFREVRLRALPNSREWNLMVSVARDGDHRVYMCVGGAFMGLERLSGCTNVARIDF